MAHHYRVAALVGSTSTTSRTLALTQAIVQALSERVAIDVAYLELSRLGPQFGSATSHASLGDEARAALRTIETADLLIAASPVYKGSYTGLFKHVVDFLDTEGLVNRPVLLAATGGGQRHALVVEHQLRPLFSFFRAQTVPTGVYASEAELEGYQVSSAVLQARIDEAAAQAALLLHASHAHAAEALLSFA